MMSCEIIKDLLPLYLDDVCSKESRELVEIHLQECEQCKKEAGKMKTTYLFEGSFIEENMREEELLMSGKRNLEQQVKKDYLEKAAFIDLFMNGLLILGFVVSIFAQIWESMELTPVILMWACVIPASVSVWEIVFIVKNRKGKESPVGHMIAMGSICLKIGLCAMALIVGITVLIYTAFS